MTDPDVLAWLDQEDAHIKSVIRRHGWFIEYVGGGECTAGCCAAEERDLGPPFAYTVGLFGLGHPELLVFGVSPGTAGGVLNELGGRVKAGADFVAGQLVTFPRWSHRAVLEQVPNPGEILFAANRYYQRPPEFSVPALQVSYDDTAGRFPWEPGYAAPGMQPRPGTFRA